MKRHRKPVVRTAGEALGLGALAAWAAAVVFALSA